MYITTVWKVLLIILLLAGNRLVLSNDGIGALGKKAREKTYVKCKLATCILKYSMDNHVTFGLEGGETIDEPPGLEKRYDVSIKNKNIYDGISYIVSLDQRYVVVLKEGVINIIPKPDQGKIHSKSLLEDIVKEIRFKNNTLYEAAKKLEDILDSPKWKFQGHTRSAGSGSSAETIRNINAVYRNKSVRYILNDLIKRDGSHSWHLYHPRDKKLKPMLLFHFTKEKVQR